MEKEVYKFSKIKRFRNVIEAVKHATYYVGKDENDEPIYDESRELPVIKYHGTVKLHGTNAGIIFIYNELINEYEFYTQKREGIVTPQHDNYGFSAFINTKPVKDLLYKIPFSKYTDEDKPIIKVYGEWIGQKIQKGVAISELSKRMVIFGVKVNNIFIDNEDLKNVKLPNHYIYNILDYKTFEVEVDFNNPKEAAEEIEKMVDEVEKECPVGKAFGVTGIGEGIVFKPINKGWFGSDFMFKAKGEKHSNVGSKNKKNKVEISPEVLKNINNLVDNIVPEWRLEQGVDHLKENNKSITIESMGIYLKWVFNDTISEELDTIMANGFEPKQISKYISTKARNWFMNYIDNKAGL